MDYLQLDITGQALALYSDGIYLYSQLVIHIIVLVKV